VSQPQTLPKAIIAGGGIGGLTAALCLAQRGMQVELFEQAAEFGAAGAGIQLSPNCSRVLHALGLESALAERGFLPKGNQFRHWQTGRVITQSTLGQSVVHEYGAPYYHIHRGDLLQVLLEAARAEPGVSLHTGNLVSGFTQTKAGVRVQLQQSLVDSQAGLDDELSGDVLIGADGIHSAVRAALWGDDQPQFTGNVAWRALVPTASLSAELVLPMSTVWWGPGKHFVHYYVRGGELVNCVCVVETADWQQESWTERGQLEDLRKQFAGWHPSIEELIDNIYGDSLYRWALYDRHPMAQWGQGRVSLLGDACHPTLPFMAQGAAMAIEDAAVLASCLAQASDGIEHALQRYEKLRRDRTASIQTGSRRNATVFHLSGVKAWLRDRAARRTGGATMRRLFSYNALTAADN